MKYQGSALVDQGMLTSALRRIADVILGGRLGPFLTQSGNNVSACVHFQTKRFPNFASLEMKI